MKKIIASLILFVSIFVSSCTPSGSNPTSNEVPTISNPTTNPTTASTTTEEATSASNSTVSLPEVTTEPFTSQDPTTQPHTHTFEETLSYDEEYHWYKSTCGHPEEEIKEKHILKEDVTDPTYEEKGYTTYSCTICEYTKIDDYVNELEHKYDEKLSYNETHHWYQCIDKGYEYLKKDEEPHSFSSKVTNPTYESGGYTTYSCKSCDYSYVSDETNPLEHKYETTLSYDETHHWYQCIDKGYEYLKKDKQPHSFTSKITNPTFESGGYTTYSCKSCEYSYIGDKTAPLEHNYEDTLSYNETHHWYRCIDEGYEHLKKGEEEHEFNEVVTPSTYTERGYTTYSCKYCDYSYKDNYTDILKYKIIYHLDGGENLPSSPVAFGIEDEVYLQPAYKEGFGFLGWFDKDGNQTLYIEKGTDHDVEITARWVDVFEVSNGKLIDFDSSYNVLSASISSNVHTITADAFMYTDNLFSLEIPTSVTRIEAGAFEDCSNLGAVLYKGTLDDWNNVTLEDVTSTPMFVAEYFYARDDQNEYYEVTDIVLSNNVTQINPYVFSEFECVDSVFIPKSVTTIETFAFLKTEMTEVIFEDGSNLTSIKDHAFNQCEYLRELDLPNGLRVIESFAFENCKSLMKLNLPSTLTSLGGSAFKSCHSLEEVIIPNGLNLISEHLFGDCTSLKSVVIPNSIEEIGDFAFTGCINLKTLDIPSSVTKIGSYTFANCDHLYSITIPNRVSTIGDFAFDGCEAVIIYCEANSKPSGWSDSWYEYEDYAPIYWNITPSDIFEKDGVQYIVENSKAIVSGSLDTTRDVVIESSVNIKGTQYNVTVVGAYSFQVRENIDSIIIPSSVTTLREYAFFCSYIEWIVIPNSVVTIEKEVLGGIYSADIFCEAESLPSTWPSDWYESLSTVYWKNEWEYDSNNKPVVKK